MYILFAGFRRFVPVAIILFVCVFSGCSPQEQPGRVLILALDGIEPKVIDLLMSQGKLPNFARLRQEGAYSPLTSMRPLLSPVVWTTIATGKTPDQHQIGHFVAINNKTGEQLPVTSQMRKTKALWNIATERDKKVAVVGWWATWPAEHVRGSIITDHLCYHFLFEGGFKEKPKDPGGKTFPAELEADVVQFLRRPSDLTREELAPFVNVSDEEFNRPFSFQDDLGHFKWALATAKSYRDIGLYLWNKDNPDLMMVYVEGVDSTSHLFGHLYGAKDLGGELAEQQKRYGNTVEQMYLYADEILGDYMAVLDENTTLMVMSDHGFQVGALQDDPSRTRDMRRVSEKFHNIEGILYMYGNKIKGHSRLDQPTILDITPTVLSLLGLPSAKDMPGRVLAEGLQELALPARIASYETGDREGEDLESDPAVDEEMLAKLESLGYLSTSSPAGERNLAAIFFESGQYAKAAEAYEELIEADPEDGALRASLAGAMGAMGRYDDALEQLNKAIELQPLNPEAYHNRAVIFQRRGEVDAAIKDYRSALRYSPNYEPARKALQSLGTSSTEQTERTPAQQLAFKMVEQASQMARRGNYEKAMSKLDEAQRIAPQFALVYQYRSNVAYLMGDKTRAVAALEKGLELEPDNALFMENLRRLQQDSEE